jgi:hypothetical protein
MIRRQKTISHPILYSRSRKEGFETGKDARERSGRPLTSACLLLHNSAFGRQRDLTGRPYQTTAASTTPGLPPSRRGGGDTVQDNSGYIKQHGTDILVGSRSGESTQNRHHGVVCERYVHSSHTPHVALTSAGLGIESENLRCPRWDHFRDANKIRGCSQMSFLGSLSSFYPVVQVQVGKTAPF